MNLQQQQNGLYRNIGILLFLSVCCIRCHAFQINPRDGKALFDEIIDARQHLKEQQIEFRRLCEIPYFSPSLEADLIRNNINDSGKLLSSGQGDLPMFSYESAQEDINQARELMSKTDVMLQEDSKATSARFRGSVLDNYTVPTESLPEAHGLEMRTTLWNRLSLTQRLIDHIFSNYTHYSADEACLQDRAAFLNQWVPHQFNTEVEKFLRPLDYQAANSVIWQGYSAAQRISISCNIR